MSLGGSDLVFWISAIGGTAFFLLRTLMMVAGGFGGDSAGAHGGGHDLGGAGHDDLGSPGGDLGGHAHDGAVPGDAGTAHAGPGAHHVQDASAAAFKLISINSVTGFFMMFGWVGLAGLKQLGLGTSGSFLAGALAGGAMMWVTGWLFAHARQLESPGAEFRIADTVGKQASVYQRIPADGRGKIQIFAAGMTREIEAVSQDSAGVESFTTVKVVRVVDPRTVSVRKTS